MDAGKTFLAFHERYPTYKILTSTEGHLWYPGDGATFCGVPLGRIDRSARVLDGCARCVEKADRFLSLTPDELARKVGQLEDPLREWVELHLGLRDGHCLPYREVALRMPQRRPGTVYSALGRAMRRLGLAAPVQKGFDAAAS